jgi:hypothetical protein
MNECEMEEGEDAEEKGKDRGVLNWLVFQFVQSQTQAGRWVVCGSGGSAEWAV